MNSNEIIIITLYLMDEINSISENSLTDISKLVVNDDLMNEKAILNNEPTLSEVIFLILTIAFTIISFACFIGKNSS